MVTHTGSPARGLSLLAWWTALALWLPLFWWHEQAASDTRWDAALLALAVGPLALAALVFRRPLSWPRGLTPLLLAWLWSAATWAWIRPDPEIHRWLDSFPPPWPAWIDRSEWLALIGLWLVCASAEPKKSLKIGLIGLGLASAYGLLQVFGLDPLSWRPEIQAPPTAPFANTNVAAEVLVPGLLAATVVFGIDSKPKRTIGLLPIGFYSGHLGVQAARISFPVGLGLLLWQRRIPRSAALALILAFAAGEAGHWALRPAWTRAESLDQALSDSKPEEEEAFRSVKVRWWIHQAGFQQLVQRPLGIGLGRFESDYPFWRPQEELRLSSANYRDKAVPRPRTPHDEFLLWALEGGWIALLLIALAVWRIAGNPTRNRSYDPALLALLIHALVRSPWSDNPVALGLTAFLLAQPATNAEPVQTQSRRGAWILTLGLMLLLVPAGWLRARVEWDKNRTLSTLVSAAESGRPLTAFETPAWPAWDKVTWSLYQTVLRQAGAPFEQQREALQQILTWDPGNLRGLTGSFLVEMLDPNGDEATGLEMLKRAEALAPAYPAVREARSLYLEHLAKLSREQASQALTAGREAVRRRYFTAHLLQALAHIRRGLEPECRQALQEASPLAGNQRAKVERVLRQDPILESWVEALVRELLPGSDRILPKLAQSIGG